ncbi:MarR family transcriptional regulator [Corynebacterium gerontici]|uniref:MarR family transcriptional regulator n=1 Tax=Corynebacterium gerontici TaxID=2079234 RepID=UPI000F4E47CA|nr:winged helix-turn-helix transcriptional regulator [Corynebacterium gerontici]
MTSEAMIRELLESNSSLSTAEITSKLGLSRSATQYALNKLLNANEVERTAPLRSPKQRYRKVTH